MRNGQHLPRVALDRKECSFGKELDASGRNLPVGVCTEPRINTLGQVRAVREVHFLPVSIAEIFSILLHSLSTLSATHYSFDVLFTTALQGKSLLTLTAHVVCFTPVPQPISQRCCLFWFEVIGMDCVSAVIFDEFIIVFLMDAKTALGQGGKKGRNNLPEKKMYK